MNAGALWIAIGFGLGLMFFGAVRNALRDFSLRKLEGLAKNNGGMEKLERIVEQADEHALSMGIVRSFFAVGAVFSCAASAYLGSAENAVTLGVAGGSAAIAFAIIVVFGVVLPAALGEHAGEKLIHRFAWLISLVHALMVLFRPLMVLDEAVRRLSGEHTTTEKDEIEDELIAAAMEGERGGSLGESEREMIENVVELSSSTTEEIMTPRTEIEGIEYTDDLLSITAYINDAGHSRIPVYTGDLDHIVGMLYAKDLLPMVGKDPSEFELKPLLREAIFVPESKAVHELLVELQTKMVHIAIVLDEYGGTTGIVTLEDVMEEIVGEIQDEYETEDDAPPEITVNLGNGSAETDARANVGDANDVLDAIGVELPENEDYDTLGGYMLALLGHIPDPGESADAEDGTHRLVAIEAEPTRIRRIRVERLDPAEAAQNADSGAVELPGSDPEVV